MKRTQAFPTTWENWVTLKITGYWKWQWYCPRTPEIYVQLYSSPSAWMFNHKLLVLVVYTWMLNYLVWCRVCSGASLSCYELQFSVVFILVTLMLQLFDPQIKFLYIQYYCMTGRAIYGEIFSSRVAVLARPKGGTIQNQRAEYFPILPNQR